MHNQALVVLIYAHSASVQGFHHLSVNSTGCDIQLLPDFLAWLWCSAGHQLITRALAKFSKGNLPYVCGNLIILSVFGLDTQFLGKLAQFHRVFNTIVRGFAFGRRQKDFRHTPTVVAVSACSCSYRSKETAGNNCIGVGTTDPNLRSFSEGVNTTRPHSTYSAAYAQLAEAALGLLQFQSIPSVFQASLGHTAYHLLRCLFAATFFWIHNEFLSNQLTLRTKKTNRLSYSALLFNPGSLLAAIDILSCGTFISS
jgi:hypothetical protein